MRKQNNNLILKTISLVTLMSLWLGILVGVPVRAEDVFDSQMQNVLENKNLNAENNKLQRDFGKTALLFEENRGQTDNKVKYFAKTNGYHLFLTNAETVFLLKNFEQIKLNFVGANKSAELKGENKAVTVSNYFRGKDQSKWLGKIPNFNEVWQKGIYQGIDAKFYGIENKQLEYDFIVYPNADANQIKLNFDGAKNVSIDEQGNLVLKTETAELIQKKPFAYQEINGERVAVQVNYELSENRVSFELGNYDRSQTLIIDPAVSYLTYIGGTNEELVDNVATDAEGNVFIVGGTESVNYPVANARSDREAAVFITKISADGSTILYNTFLDGSDDDGIRRSFIGFLGNDIAVSELGEAYITGFTQSSDFPISEGAYQRYIQCERHFGRCLITEEAFVTKLDTQGAIVYSTFVGGRQQDLAHGIAIDPAGKAYITGETGSGLTFPRKNGYEGTGVIGGNTEAFLVVLNSSGTDIVYATGLGGIGEDGGTEIALDAVNNVYITGGTSSNNFPVKNAFQSTNRGGTEAFVAKFNTSLTGNSSLIYSTYLGGSGTDVGNSIAVTSGGQATVVGLTGSVNFPLANAIRSTNQINEAFVSVLSSTGASLVNSTFLGGADQEEANGVALDNIGNIYVTGNTLSNNFPLALPFQSTRAGNRDAFVTKLKFGRGILSSSYLGGTQLDTGKGIAVRNGHIFAVGVTSSNNLSTTAGVIQEDLGGLGDGFVAKILDTKLDSVGFFRPGTHGQFTSPTITLTQSTTNVVAQTATFTSGLAGTTGVSGDFDGDGIDTTGSFTNGTWKIRNVNFPTANPVVTTFVFGQTGDLPVVGDWNNDGFDTPGVYRIVGGQGQFLLTNSTSTSPTVDLTITFGIAGDLPIAGDWNADGVDSVGVFRGSEATFFLTNSTDNAQNPQIDQVNFFGVNGDLPMAGDWNGDGVDTISVWRPSTREFFLTNDGAIIAQQFVFGVAGDRPIVGDWDGIPNP